MNKIELEQMIHNELARQQSQLGQKSSKKEDFQKSTPPSNSNTLTNGHDQMRVIYDI